MTETPMREFVQEDPNLLGLRNHVSHSRVALMPGMVLNECLIEGCVLLTFWRLCCANHLRDSSCESSVIAGMHEQTNTLDIQDQELAGL